MGDDSSSISPQATNKSALSTSGRRVSIKHSSLSASVRHKSELDLSLYERMTRLWHFYLFEGTDIYIKAGYLEERDGIFK